MKPIAIGALTLAAMLIAAGCVTAETPLAGKPSSQQQGAAEVDLTGAHLNKRKFLIGISMLGKSVERDIEILRKITGYTFQPDKGEGLLLSDGSRRFSAFAPQFKDNPMLVNGRYSYTVASNGVVHSNASFVLNKEIACIKTDEVESVLGLPTRIITKQEARRKGLGPSDVWHLVYDYPPATRVYFAFVTGLCVNDITQTSNRNLGR